LDHCEPPFSCQVGNTRYAGECQGLPGGSGWLSGGSNVRVLAEWVLRFASSKRLSLDGCNQDLAVKLHKYSRRKKVTRYSSPESNLAHLEKASFPGLPVPGHNSRNIQQYLCNTASMKPLFAPRMPFVKNCSVTTGFAESPVKGGQIQP
jgi:hypothetical protein